MLTENDILYRDEWLIVINKPAGLLVHPSWIDKDETETAIKQLRDLINRWVYLIHRLDKPTSGILVFALSKETARTIADSFMAKMVQKEYTAIVRGYTAESDTIDYPLVEIWDKMVDHKRAKNKPAQEAITKYERLAITELPIAVSPHPSARYSLLRIQPLTGRNRQIRRHMKHIFHPIIGDHKHGHNVHNRMFEERFGNKRLLLHASRIQFEHPVTGEKLDIKAPLDSNFSAMIQRLFKLSDFI